MRRAILGSIVAFLATAALAQQAPIPDPDDAIDPRQRNGSLFISRLILGGASGVIDDYRPLHQNVGIAELANSFYWRQFQFDYKHNELFGKDDPVSVCLCGGTPIYFPTPPSHDAIPAPPPPGRKETLQVGWYHGFGGDAARPPVMLRYRLSANWQPIDTDLTAIATGTVSRLFGRERSVGLDANTYFRVRGHDVWGSLIYARTVRTGTTDNRAQNEFAYKSRFPARALGPILLRATLTLAAVSGRGSSGINAVNPAFEAFWRHAGSGVNLHLAWSPLAMRSGAEGWHAHSQIALFVDRALFVKSFAAHDANR
jgi:hypothetical protein